MFQAKEFYVMDGHRRSENADKGERGKIRMDSLDQRLNELQKGGKIKSYEKKKRFTLEGYQSDQFYAPFEIEFDDGAKWEVFSSTSYKSDREKGNQWDAFNIKNIDSSVEYCYLVIFPDTEKERELIEHRNIKLQRMFSPIDEIIDDSDFFDRLEKKSMNSRRKTLGQIHDEKGRTFEKRVALALSYKGNLKKLQGDPLQSGLDFDFLFTPIVNAFGLETERIITIEATDKIPKLPSGGSPKADIAVTVLFDNGSKEIRTISCKTSSKKTVSVHQYPAETFIKVLDIRDKRLQESLKKFQECGGYRALGNEYGEEYVDCLREELPKYNETLSLWVFGGFGGEANKPLEQFAQYLLVRAELDNEISIYPINTYVKKAIATDCRKPFNTPFQWTYASGSKGKSIQLKGRIGRFSDI